MKRTLIFYRIPIIAVLLFVCFPAISQTKWLNGIYASNGEYVSIVDKGDHCTIAGDMPLLQNGKEMWYFHLKSVHFLNIIVGEGYIIEVSKTSRVAGKNETVVCGINDFEKFIYFNLNPQTDVDEDRGTIVLKPMLPPEDMMKYGYYEYERRNNLYAKIVMNYVQPGLPKLKGGTLPESLQRSLFDSPVCIGQSPATNGSGVYYYQWEKSNTPLSWEAIPGATEREYCPLVSGYYRRKVTDSKGEVAYTNSHLFQLWDDPNCMDYFEWRSDSETNFRRTDVLPFNPEGGTYMLRFYFKQDLNTAGLMTWDQKVLAEQPDGSYVEKANHTWYSQNRIAYMGKTGIETMFNIDENTSGKKNRGKVIYVYKGILDNGGVYNNNQLFVAEIPFEQDPFLYVDEPLSPPIIRGNQLLYAGEQPDRITVTTPTVGGFRNTYLWQYRTTNSDWKTVDIYKRTDYEDTCMPASLGYESIAYRLRVSSFKEAQVVYSNEVWLTLAANLSGGSITGSQIISTVQNVAPFTNITSATGGKSQSYSYQWQYNLTENKKWKNITGADGQNYTPENYVGTKHYRRMVICGNDSAYSNEVSLTVRKSLHGGSIAGTQVIQAGQQATSFSNKEAASGGLCQDYNYAWQYYVDDTWQTINGATGLTYTPETVLGDRRYRRQSCCGHEIAYSNEVSLTAIDSASFGTLHPQIPNTHTVSTLYDVGEIPIRSMVSPLGSASHTVPIEVVPGLNGLQPNISIVYNSNRRNG